MKKVYYIIMLVLSILSCAFGIANVLPGLSVRESAFMIGY